LGAAKTGSGKTLAFLVPLIEKLFRSKCNIDDGLGAIVSKFFFNFLSKKKLYNS
jgi:superfamily II DNA/RNA helicase